jgi:hypothetical protein
MRPPSVLAVTTLPLSAAVSAQALVAQNVPVAVSGTPDEIGAGAVGLGIWLGGTVAGGVTGALIRTERWRPAAWPPDQPPAEVVSRFP